MFVVLLTFSTNREQAAQHMDGHKEWLKRGFDDGVFLLAGSLMPNAGGAILASGVSREDLQAIVDQDPFVAERIVDAQIHEISPARADDRMAFLLA